MAVKFKTKLLLIVIVLSLLVYGCTKPKNTDDIIIVPPANSSSPNPTENTNKPAVTPPSDSNNTSGEAAVSNNGYIFPKSQTKKLTEAEVTNLKPELLAFARNEIFARRGYVFTSKIFKDYFAKKTWYKPDSEFKTNKLNDIEKYNIYLIKSFETKNNNKKPSTAVINTYKADVVISYDLNGDNLNETIIYSPNKGQLLIDNHVVDFVFDTPSDSFAIADIDVKDKFKEILISDYGPSDDYITYYYYFEGANVVKLGETQGIFNSGITSDGSGKVNALTRGHILQTWFFNKTFQLTKQHKLEEISQGLYTTDYAVTLKTQLKLYNNKGDASPTISINKGQTVKIIGTDDKEWCLIQTSNGTKGWIAVDNFSIIRNNGLDAAEVFDGLCFAD